jgi:hypothetical protein
MTRTGTTTASGLRAAALSSALAATLGACAQFTTSDTERAGLQAAADAAGQAYLDCLREQAAPYIAGSDDARAIATTARGNCTAARAAAGRAQSELQATNYILADREVTATLADLDARGEAAVAEQVLRGRATAPPPARPAPAAPLAASPPAVTGGDAYLSCMREQAGRWAAVDEPAAVIADAAHGRCAGRLAGVAGAPQLESEGRALVTGIVLDRKAAPATTTP